MVGTSGSCGTRLAELMAIARTLPVELSSWVAGIGAKYICASLRITAVVASGAPLYGMCTMLILASCLKISADRYEVLATPAEEKLSWPGFSFASVMKSFSVLAANSGGTIATRGNVVTVRGQHLCVAAGRALGAARRARQAGPVLDDHLLLPHFGELVGKNT